MEHFLYLDWRPAMGCGRARIIAAASASGTKPRGITPSGLCRLRPQDRQ
ncbi:MAG: hypothetical protein ACK59Y_01340 [Betaproteobacteria bacterium]|jgi:hypothetical protein